MLLLESAPTSRPPVARCPAPAVQGKTKIVILPFIHRPTVAQEKQEEGKFYPQNNQTFFFPLYFLERMQCISTKIYLSVCNSRILCKFAADLVAR